MSLLPLKPSRRPNRPFFSSGPCVKYPSWSLDALKNTPLGRSHRAAPGVALLQNVINKTRHILSIPDDYRIAIMPGSTTGAMEAALWSLLGPKGVDVFSWDVFGNLWVHDVQHQLRLCDVRIFSAPFGQLPEFSSAEPQRDKVFLWCGTSSGVWLPPSPPAWLAEKGEGLALCDATSAVFAVDLPWAHLDATAFSWQKGLGAEAAHGMLVLSPRAIARLQSYTPPWPMPRLFRMTNKEALLEGLFKGETLNTPSLLCAQDALSALEWMENQGGMPAMCRRVEKNFQAVSQWVEKNPWVTFIAELPETRAKTAICLKIIDPAFDQLDIPAQRAFLMRMEHRLAQEEVAFEVVNHLLAPPSLRLWGGPTMETTDLEALFPWIEWAFTLEKNNNSPL